MRKYQDVDDDDDDVHFMQKALLIQHTYSSSLHRNHHPHHDECVGVNAENSEALSHVETSLPVIY